MNIVNPSTYTTSGGTINNQNKTVTPTTSSQSITADAGYTGLGTVTVNAVTSAIDANITAGNIKKDVEILGVTGTYEGSGSLYTIKSALILPASISNSANVQDFGITFYPEDDTIYCTIVPTTSNGYGSQVLRGGDYSQESLIGLFTDLNGSGGYQLNRYTIWHQQLNTGNVYGVTNTSFKGVGLTALLSPTTFAIGGTGSGTVNHTPSNTKSTTYGLAKTGNFQFIELLHYDSDGIKAHILPATDGINNGYLEMVSNTFYPITGATVI